MTGEAKNSALSDLRKRAEELFSERVNLLDVNQRQEISDVFHELQLRELEVEIQNEELKVAQEQLQISHDRYADLYHFAPVGYFTLDEQGKILDVNETGAVLLSAGPEELIGKLFAQYVVREDQQEFYFYHKALIETLALQSSEIRLIRTDGTRFYGQLQGIMVQNYDESLRKYQIAISDVTQRRQRLLIDNLLRAGQHLTSTVEVQTLLKQSVAAVIETLPSAEIAILWMYDKEKDVLVTRACAGHHIEDLPELTMSPHEGLIGQIFRTGEVRNIQDVREEPLFIQFGDPYIEPVRSAMGVPIYAADRVIGVLFAYNHSSVRNFGEDAPILLETLATQISLVIHNAQLFEQISNAHEQMRHLTQRVVSAQEEERRRVSRELHDEAGQALTLLKLDLSNIKKELPDASTNLHQRLTNSIDLVDQTLRRVRTLSHMLRPPVLDTMELNDVLRTHCEDFMLRTSIQVTYKGEDVYTTSDAVKITLYRFLQEALTNVVRHAHATQIEAQLNLSDQQINLMVQDNGDGFDMEAETVQMEPRGIGLLGIRERLASIGGELEVYSKLGDGVRLIARIPWKDRS